MAKRTQLYTDAELTELWRPRPDFIGPSMPPMIALCVPRARLPAVLAGLEQQLYESVAGFAPVAASIAKERAGS